MKHKTSATKCYAVSTYRNGPVYQNGISCPNDPAYQNATVHQNKFAYLSWLALPLLLFLVLCCLSFAGCEELKTQSVKELTHPYINQYVCTKAQFGEKDLLNDVQEIRITLLDQESGELLVIASDGTRTATKFPYTFDSETSELTAEIGIFGYRFHESITVQNGNFTLTHIINGTPLLLHFEVK